MDTIYALASARGKAGVAVIRISGPQAFAAGRSLMSSLPEGRSAVLRALRDRDGAFLDEALVLRFDKGASFTGEETLELQTHGSVAVIDAVLSALSGCEGLRLAEPGEFTRRALLNGQMDLPQVEALSDLIEAETEAQRLQAQRGLAGALGELVDAWRTDLIRAAALLEATIDFADEEVPEDVTPEVRDLLEGVIAGVDQAIRGVAVAERVREGFEVAIVGAPNLGKSTLLNHMAGRDAAITSEVAGTTRDVIEVRMNINGLPVTLLDTAGLRETTDHVETLGIERARQRAKEADLRIHLLELASDRPSLGVEPGDILVVAKSDLKSDELGVSGLTGQGVPELLEQVSGILSRRMAQAGLATRERHRVALVQGLVPLRNASEMLDAGPDSYDICAEEIRIAVRSMSALLGHVDVEHVLDSVFANFCLGK
ncbi:MAG: tRNA uridine-5-carboxymethylaminomethyl(34) synthesis GTPase MnmE [Paracoccaceae bacterium]|nr:tRNA uridine-5-carboxymethylaminomethyl(34) synthesis GTPase MnmE [Paracoccaceae bacterium]